MRVIIAGSRSFTDMDMLKFAVKTFESVYGSITEVVSGTARGGDKLGEQWAEANKVPCKKFPANWDLYGKSAGYKRNVQMAEYADGCIVLWDGHSKGSKHMIKIALEYSLITCVYNSAKKTLTIQYQIGGVTPK